MATSSTSPRLPELPLLPGIYHVVELDEDRVQICNAGRSVVLSGPGLTARVTPLLAALDGRHDIATLQRQFADLMPQVLAALQQRALLLDAGPPNEEDAAAVGLRAAVLAQLPESRQRLATATVFIAGCGPAASTAACLAVQAGLGHLRLMDDGRVSAHDVEVSPMLRGDAAGRRRVDATADACRSAGAVSVTSDRNDRADPLQGVDLVIVEAAYSTRDGPAAVADAALAAGVPYLVHGQDALLAMVSPVIRAGGRPCHLCLETRRLSHVRQLPEHRAYLAHRAADQSSPDAFLAAHTCVVAGILATRMIQLLIGEPAHTDQCVAWIDCEHGEVQREQLTLVAGCAGCGDAGCAR